MCEAVPEVLPLRHDVRRPFEHANEPPPVPADWRVASMPAVQLGREYHELKRVVPGAVFAPYVGLMVPGADTVLLRFAARGEMLAPEHESLTLETASLVEVEQHRNANDAAALAATAEPWMRALTAQHGKPACTWAPATAYQRGRAGWQWEAKASVVRLVLYTATAGAMPVALLQWAATDQPKSRAGAAAPCETLLEVWRRAGPAPF
jgi:hypothetical protein